MVRFNIKLIDNYIKENNISKKEFCQRCRVCSSVLRKIYKNQINLSATSVFRIIKLLKIHPHEFFLN